MSYFKKLFSHKKYGFLLLVTGLLVLIPVEFSGYRNRLSRKNLLTKEYEAELAYLQQTVQEPNSKRRLEIIEKIFYPRITEISISLEKIIDSREWPLPEKSCLYIVRRGRVRQHLGFDPAPFLPKDWEEQFFPALHNGGQIFENKSGYFYPRYIPYENFMRFEDSFNPLNLAGERFVFYFIREESYILFFLLHSSAVSNDDLRNCLFRLDAEAGGTIPLWPGRLMTVILLSMSFFCGIYQNKNSFRYRMFWSGGILFLVFDLCFLQWSLDYFISRKLSIERKIQEEFQQELRKLEEGLASFLQSEAVNVVNNYSRDPDLEAAFWPYDLKRFRAGMNGLEKSQPTKMEQLIFCMMEIGMPAILQAHPDFAGFDTLAEKETFRKKFVSENLQVLGKLFRVSPKSAMENMVFSADLSDQFRFYQLMDRGYYWLWHYDSNADNLRAFLAIYEQPDVLFKYLQEFLPQWTTGTKSPFRLILREKDGAGRFSASNQTDVPFDSRRAVFRALSRGFFQFSELELGDGKWLCFFAESGLLDHYVMGFMLPEELYKPLSRLQKQLLSLQLLFVILLFLTLWLLNRLLIDPLRVLQSGFDAMSGGRYDRVLIAPLSDERGVCLNSFDFMAKELQEREKLLPFVAGQVLRLFGDDEGNFCDFVQDEACVLFSDIRSFTTISEQYEPEKIVEMLNEYFTLWQSVVEKYDGIIERFIGDAVVVIFFRRFSENYAKDAVNAAYDLMQELAAFNRLREMSGQFTIKNGIGLACGEVGLSVLGDEKRRHFFAMGEAVKKAEELEAASKIGRFTHIFMNKTVTEKLPDSDFDFVPADNDKGTGREQIFELKA
jgi:class 3 adenylate cyclase